MSRMPLESAKQGVRDRLTQLGLVKTDYANANDAKGVEWAEAQIDAKEHELAWLNSLSDDVWESGATFDADSFERPEAGPAAEHPVSEESSTTPIPPEQPTE